MFVRTSLYHRLDFYLLDVPTERQMRPLQRIDDSAVRRLVTGDTVTQVMFWIMPSTRKRVKQLVGILADRERSVQLTTYSGWAPGQRCDLSVEVLKNQRINPPTGKSTLSLDALDACMKGTRIDYNDSWEERRHGHYKKLLDAYFTATIELDRLARSEPDMSDHVKQQLIDRIAVYADPTRELLLHMSASVLGNSYNYNAVEKAVDQLTASWDDSQVVATEQSVYEIEQADRRVQAFLAGNNLYQIGQAHLST